MAARGLFRHASRTRQAIRELVRPLVGAEADRAVFLPLEQQDWVKASLEGLDPVRAGRILVHGSHDRARVRPNDVAIEIEAALAFGTGHHGTTRGCLLAFADEFKRRVPRRVLDVGTGTGILAFAAAKLLKRPVVAGDIDPEAIRVARENARLNGIGSLLKLYVGPGVRSPLADRPGAFDLVFANILAKPLRVLAPGPGPRRRGERNADPVRSAWPGRGRGAVGLCGARLAARAPLRSARAGRRWS